jgi:NADH:ubiquinone oxidoreductase subunit F (NADH-binding)
MALMPIQSDVESFYHLDGADLGSASCQGMACFAARHILGDRWGQIEGIFPRVYCLGKCYAAPASGHDENQPNAEVHCRRPVVLERIASGGALTLEAYRTRGGLVALEKALAKPTEQVVTEVEASQLRGRGGAGFPTGKKWRIVASQNRSPKYVVANLDEGDPGAYVDRMIAELDPFSLLEGMAIAAYAVGAEKGWIYVRCEYPRAVAMLQQAIASAQNSGSNRQGFLGTDLHFEVELVVGRGSYMCGEETAMLNAMEHQRPVARARPPYVAEQGLFGQPTVVNNAETLASIPWIIRNGADHYAAMGVPGSRGTKVVSLNSLFRRPGLYEVEFGIPLREIVDDCGGGLREVSTMSGLIIGGPLAGVVPPTLLDTLFGFNELRMIGASVGHGGMVAFDQRTSIAQLVHHVFAFGAYESCGKCTPCRLGSGVIERMFTTAADEKSISDLPQQRFVEIVNALRLTSLCGFGTGLAEFAQSILRHYSQELRSCFK